MNNRQGEDGGQRECEPAFVQQRHSQRGAQAQRDAVLPAQAKGRGHVADHGKNYRDRRFYRRTEALRELLCALAAGCARHLISQHIPRLSANRLRAFG